MINLIKGARIPDCEKLQEGFRVAEGSVEAVVNAEKIAAVLRSFADQYSTQSLFIFIEVPCKLTDENRYHEQGDHNTHKDIYYLDDISSDEVNGLFDLFEEILINDGMACCGIGTEGAEIGKYKYNMIVGYAEDPSGLQSVFEKNGIPKNDGLVLPWDIINENNPGESMLYEDEREKTVYDIIEALSEVGLYKYETRNE